MSKAIEETGLHGGRYSRLDYYARRQLFAGMNLSGKSILDVGGGNGILAAWAVVDGGARQAVVLEPLLEGSTSSVHEQFHQLKQVLGGNYDIELLPVLLEELDDSHSNFDIVLLHNSINHVLESHVDRVAYSLESQRAYHGFFAAVRDRMKPGGTILISDCTNRSLFSDLRLRNPLAPTIDWRIHQPPEQWSGMLSEHGFVEERVHWSTYNAFGRVGGVLMSNRVAAYCTFSHYTLQMRSTLEPSRASNANTV